MPGNVIRQSIIIIDPMLMSSNVTDCKTFKLKVFKSSCCLYNFQLQHAEAYANISKLKDNQLGSIQSPIGSRIQSSLTQAHSLH